MTPITEYKSIVSCGTYDGPDGNYAGDINRALKDGLIALEDCEGQCGKTIIVSKHSRDVPNPTFRCAECVVALIKENKEPLIKAIAPKTYDPEGPFSDYIDPDIIRRNRAILEKNGFVDVPNDYLEE